MLFDEKKAKYRQEIHEFASVHHLFGNKSSWYNLEWEDKIANMHERFYEFNKRIKDYGIKINKDKMNELIHVV